ncbi:hypothetical protein Syun_029179 [Stephania yunnanensis]|uniref:Lipoxygenase n=1 Tax=Stephania yunnanensis TaxID=152371 RepID=A0AAP0E4W7_9MAGN
MCPLNLQNLLRLITCKISRGGSEGIVARSENSEKVVVRGRAVVVKKKVLDLKDFRASVIDRVYEFLGRGVSVPARQFSQCRFSPTLAGELSYDVTFEWEEHVGVPGALIVNNSHHSEFFLKTITLEDVPGAGRVHFVCNSWVYPTRRYKYKRVFFSNQTYLPCNTPEPLRIYREEELANLRGNGSEELKEWDRVYDYAYYNNLGDPDKGPEYARPVLGGSSTYPYPRRIRTGRRATKADPKTEKRLPLLSLNFYVPRDERFGSLKMSDFLASALKSLAQVLVPELKALFDKTPNEFDSFQDVFDLYEGGIELPTGLMSKIKDAIPVEIVKELLRSDGEQLLKLPLPQVIKDHHDTLMPYLNRINRTTTKTYATRTLLFSREDGTLKPLAIELSLPHPQGEKRGVTSKVFTPAENGVEGSVWQLAKAYAAVSDSGSHQLISHWLNTHAVIEPFTIATNRQLSVLHPIYKLLQPHFKDTININSLARQILINAGGILERTVFPSKYAMELSSFIYKEWIFTDQALPVDLINRGVAVPDSSKPHGLRLLIEDYPYAVDGLEIWSAIQTWVHEYCSFYYSNDEMVKNDTELQSWWTELREVGHGDKKDDPWWPKMQTLEELTQTCTTIIWVASALHAAVNFGQYPYAGFLPNRPTISRRFMPEPGTPEYAELESNPDKAYLKTITSQLPTLLGITLIEILSRHSSDEIYLGQRETPEWTSDLEALEAFERFSEKLVEIETKILEMNENIMLRNRTGPVNVPYTLLYPSTSDYSKVGGLTGHQGGFKVRRWEFESDCLFQNVKARGQSEISTNGDVELGTRHRESPFESRLKRITPDCQFEPSFCSENNGFNSKLEMNTMGLRGCYTVVRSYQGWTVVFSGLCSAIRGA